MSCCGDSEGSRQKPRKLVAILVSCCIFLFIFCACLLTALVIIGRHTLYNSNINRPSSSVTKTIKPAPLKLHRLPNDTKPVLYDIFLSPNLETGLYKGTVNITVEITQFRSNVILHNKDLSIDTVQLTYDDGKEVSIANVKENKVEETLVISSKNKLTPGIYYLHINFSGSLLKKIKGFYMSSYKSVNGTSRKIATSKFEPTYARQAFPCFDEPNLKAKYKVRLLKPKNEDYIALSNNPEASVESLNDSEIVSFQETVPMSTYLVCFIVSDFKSTEYTFDNDGNQIQFRVFASPQQLVKTTYAGQVGKKVIEYYVKYFGIPYPLPKLDMVAIPDFVSGAMEHWGLVTYRETALLYTDATHSSANKQRVATVIAHELAHSWFGNLVTMNWWNDLWLNEGFASYIEYKGVLQAEPSWGMLDQFLIDDLHPVLSLDATLGSHPIIVTVETPDQITEVFDTISYNKGASILRMLENTVGEENFKNGVTQYLKNHAYGNAVTQNLLDELESIVGSKLNVTEFMNTFTVQMGYPILDVTVNGDEYKITQKRFLKDSSLVDDSQTPYHYKWTVPITYLTDLGQSNDYTLFKYNEASATIKKPAGANWIKFNYNQIGYYRVNYPVAEWNKLIEVYSSLSISNRAHLLEESFSIAEAGQLSYEIPLSLTKKLTEELDYVPWSVASSKLSTIKSFLADSASEAPFSNYIRSITDEAYKKLTWTEEETDGHLKRLGRVVVLGLACSVDHEDCLAAVKTKFDNWIENSETVTLSQDLRGLIYRYGMKTASEATWEKMFQIFAKENDANEKLKLLYGLTSVKNEALLTKLLKLAEDETYIRSQDYFTLLSYASSNPLGTSLVWNYVRENWLTLVARFGLNDRNLGNMIATITKTFSTEQRLKEMEAFFAKYPDAGAGASKRVQALETVNNNIKWLIKHKKVIEDWIVQI